MKRKKIGEVVIYLITLGLTTYLATLFLQASEKKLPLDMFIPIILLVALWFCLIGLSISFFKKKREY